MLVVYSSLILTSDLSRERINRLNDIKIRLDRVSSFLENVEQVCHDSAYHFRAS